MNNTSTVDLLIDMAQKKRDTAARRMAEAMSRCAEAEKKMTLLKQYLADYQSRQRSVSSTDVVVLTNFHAFLDKLQAAIAHQQEELIGMRRSSLHARQAWEHAVQHFKSIEVLQQRRVASARTSAVREQQKQHDEQAARMASTPLALAS